MFFFCYHLSRHEVLRYFVCAFPYIKRNSKEICEKILLPSFLRKMLISAFLLRFKVNYPEKNCLATPVILCGFQQPVQKSTFSEWS